MTMNKKQSKRQRDIKTKLMAAICMLLVSSIMMVSTTYAWFTLSTAPEVTGITTSVGANGNLEMALQPLHGESTKITSGTSDSMAVKPVTEANITWGNLVNVSNGYGLDKITLYPAALKIADNKIPVNPLSTPEYGADGRVADLKDETLTGVYQNGAFFEKAQGTRADGTEGEIAVPYGVRAIGTSSGMTPRTLAYRAALSAANTAAGMARSAASTTLNTNGSTLAEVAIAHGLSSDPATESYTKDQVQAMKNVVNDMLNNSLSNIEIALKQYIVASSIAPAATETTYEELTKTILEASLADLAGGKVTGAVVSSDMVNWIGKLTASQEKVQTAKTKLDALEGDGPYGWDDISDALSTLVNTSNLTINGFTVAEAKADPGKLASKVLSEGGMLLTMKTGSGVFADVADFCGNYSAGIIIPKVSYGAFGTVENVKATMNTDGVVPTYLSSAETGVADFVSGTGSGGENPLTDFYGYIIDLAFRTNASGSALQLQADAIDRIYADGSNANTMGHGANMSFSSPSTTFSAAAVKDLMGAIRVVFFDTNTRDIIAYARLDKDKTTTAENGAIQMPLYLCQSLTDPTAKVNSDDTAYDDSIAIMELEQNTIHELSVMVYLDGNAVQNDDVAADAAKSLLGAMNLQFSSSANLSPMQYSDLMSGNGGALDNIPTPSEPEVEAVDLKDVTTINDGYTVEYSAFATKGGMKCIAVRINDTDGNNIAANYTVTINGQDAKYMLNTGWYIVADAAPESVVVNVTPAAPAEGT